MTAEREHGDGAAGGAGQNPDKRRTRRTAEELAEIAGAKAERAAERAKRRADRRLADSARAAAGYAAELRRIAERDAERQLQEDGIAFICGHRTEGARRFAALVEARRRAVQSAGASRPLVAGRALRAIDKAAAAEFDRKRAAIRDAVEDVGTGLTVMKLRQKPLAKLADEGAIGMEEIDAAEEIATAFYAISSSLGARGGLNIDRVDGGSRGDRPWSRATANAVAHFQAWANHWSGRKKSLDDPMLDVVVGAVVEERSITAIAADVGRRHETVSRGLVAGLRDYAARADIVSGSTACRWIAEAEAAFLPPGVLLAKAASRGRFEGR